MKKKKLSLVVSFLAILIMFWGCTKDLIEPTNTVKVISNGDGITVSTLGTYKVAEGDNFVVSSVAKLGYNRTIKIEGNEVPLLEDNYILQGIHSDVTIEVNGSKSESWELFQRPWKTQMWKRRLLTETEWKETFLPPDIEEFVMTFSGDRILFHNLKGELKGDMDYIIKNDSLIFGKGGTRTKITELTSEKVSYTFVSPFYNGPYDQDHTKDAMIQVSYVPYVPKP